MIKELALVLAVVVFVLFELRWRRVSPKLMKAAAAAASRHKRRAKALGISGPHFSAEDFVVVIRSQGSKCYDCGRKVRLTVGHARPLSRGGNNSRGNIFGQCLQCNQAQGVKVHRLAKKRLWEFLNRK